jgi:quinol monooxygenase YgiN
MLTVIALYRARPGMGDQVAAILAKHVAATRAESGCVEFIACRGLDDRDRFALFEQYEDEAAFQVHRESDHFRRYIDGGVVPLLDERVWQRYEEVE